MTPDQTPANTLTEPSRDNTPEERRRASLVIADRCPDPAERLELLQMLGLAPAGFRWRGRLHSDPQRRHRIEETQ